MTEPAVLDEVVAAEEELDPAELAADDGGEGEGLSEEEADPEARRGLDDPREELLEPPEGTRDLRDFADVAQVAGVPLWYERTGSPAPRRFPASASFVPVLERTVKQVVERAPAAFGRLERISSAGLFVQKAGMHGKGQACDWDRFVFGRVEIAPIERDHASSDTATRQRYWALGAICRSNSCYVLHGEYDAAHGDHFHQDVSTGVDFNTQPSTVKLLQAVLNEIYGREPRLAVDGEFGRRTSEALADALQRVGLPNNVRDANVWRRFLRRSGRLGFQLSVR
jgi:hypothetical protein